MAYEIFIFAHFMQITMSLKTQNLGHCKHATMNFNRLMWILRYLNWLVSGGPSPNFQVYY